MNIRVLVDWDAEAKAFSAVCPELNWIASQGTTKDQAITNLREAIELMLTPIDEKLFEASPTAERVQIAL